MLRYLLPTAAVVTLAAGAGLAAAETKTVGSFGEGLWWALSLMTTVGFVGEAPLTTAGKIISAVVMVLGFILLAMTTAAVASLFVREDKKPAETRERSFEDEVLGELREMRARLERLEGGRGRATGAE
jgi:hypothetical protein